MKNAGIAVFIGILALITGCTKGPTKYSHRDDARIKKKLFEVLKTYQSQAAGLYALSDGHVRIGNHSIYLNPVIEANFVQGKTIYVGMRVEVAIDGVQRPEATYGTVGTADSREESINDSLHQWFFGFAVPFFECIGERKPIANIGGYNIFAGPLALRGGKPVGWMDSSNAMSQNIINAILPVLSAQSDLVVLALMIAVPPVEKPNGECRINGVVSGDLAQRLLSLDWPRLSEDYLYKQVFVLKKSEPKEPT